MHPSNNIEKKYIAKIEGILSIDELKQLKEGILIDGIKCYPKKVRIKNKDLEKNTSIVEISLVEGRNHIVKKIFSAIGHEVIKLKREQYAFLDVKDLQSGEYRTLSLKEIKRLYNLKSK
jgi:23S rRNA pseudouridine2605 synthase